jgi:uncharacterized protein YndB with AHSA1/START domain
VSFNLTGCLSGDRSATRLVFTSTWLEDEEGNPNLENFNIITFEEQDGKTKVTVHVVDVKSTPEAAGALAGMEMG